MKKTAASKSWIVCLASCGAFAEIISGVDGLIHISQIADKKIEKVEDILKKDDVVEAKIVGIDDEKQKVSLSIRALLPEAPKAEDAEEFSPEDLTTEVVSEESTEGTDEE